MKVLVTGGGGFLGKAIVRQLLVRGDTVRSLARGDYPELREIGVETHQGDLADSAVVSAAVQGCDAVLHVAAKAGHWGNYASFYQPNVIGTENIIAACREQGVSRLVFTSSPSVIDQGDPIEGGTEALPYPQEHVSIYSKTKAISEQAVLAANGPDLATIAIRPPIIWGPGDTQFMPRFIASAKRGSLVRVGADEYRIDHTYIDNAAAAHLLALDKLSVGSPIAGKAYFISNDDPRPIHEIINRMIGAAGFPPMRVTLPTPVAYGLAGALETAFKVLPTTKEPPFTRFVVGQLVKPRWFDISAAKRDLGYQPTIDFDEGMRRLTESLEATSR